MDVRHSVFNSIANEERRLCMPITRDNRRLGGKVEKMGIDVPELLTFKARVHPKRWEQARRWKQANRMVSKSAGEKQAKATEKQLQISLHRIYVSSIATDSTPKSGISVQAHTDKPTQSAFKAGIIPCKQKPRERPKVFAERTEMMLYALDYYQVEGVDLKKQTLTHNDLVYQILCLDSQNVLGRPVASVGETPFNREVVVLDAQSAVLMALYKNFKESLCVEVLPSDPGNLLRSLDNWMNQIFSKRDVKALVAQWQESKSLQSSVRSTKNGEKSTPLIPIDYFIENKTGTCRHFTLLGLYMLQKAIDDGLIYGEVYYVRADLQGGRGHAWMMFKEPSPSANAWVVDLFSHEVANLEDPKDYNSVMALFKDEKVVSTAKDYYGKGLL